MDVFGPFIRECCVIHRDASVWASELKVAYQSWCASNGVREETQTKFGRYLTTKGWKADGSSGRVKRLGIGLKATDSDSSDSSDSKVEKVPYEASIGDSPDNPQNCQNPQKVVDDDREVL